MDKSRTLAGVALCLDLLCCALARFLLFWIIPTANLSPEVPVTSLGELLPVSDMLACPEDLFSSDELLLHCRARC